MTVKQLRELLAAYPDDMPIAYSLHSEMTIMETDDIAACDLFDNGGYLSRVYQPADRAKAKPHLCFPGN